MYEGDGSSIVSAGADLPLPAYALDGGEEPQIAGLRIIDRNGEPWRPGSALGSEYSDRVMERQNRLYLAHSKLRAGAIGPELRTGPVPEKLEGESRILRDGAVIRRKPFPSGEGNILHTIANLDHHHFTYGMFRRPGDLHVHFFGTATLSFGIRAEPRDMFEIEVAEFGAPLRNRLAPTADGFAYGAVAVL